ncbi:MAG TPA: hypothetical protein VL863_01400 [bacterium]|nr:hypothetical protein [bacterium]
MNYFVLPFHHLAQRIVLSVFGKPFAVGWRGASGEETSGRQADQKALQKNLANGSRAAGDIRRKFLYQHGGKILKAGRLMAMKYHEVENDQWRT